MSNVRLKNSTSAFVKGVAVILVRGREELMVLALQRRNAGHDRNEERRSNYDSIEK